MNEDHNYHVIAYWWNLVTCSVMYGIDFGTGDTTILYWFDENGNLCYKKITDEDLYLNE